MSERLPLNLRVVAFLLVWLVLVDLGLNFYLDRKILVQQEWRINNADLGSLEAVFDRIAGASGVVVVCIGDSEMYGSSTSVDKTIPSYLGRELRCRHPGKQITVFNVGIKGLKPSEAYFLVRKLATLPVSALIYNVSGGWFTSTEGVKYTDVVTLAGAQSEAARCGVKLPAQTWEDILGQQVARFWSFYRYKQVVSRDLIGLRDKIQGTADRLENPVKWEAAKRREARLPLNWRLKPELLQATGPKQKLATLNLTPKNRELQLYQRLIDTWQQTGRPAVFYLTPANWDYLAQKYNLNKPDLRADQLKLLKAAADKGITGVDYTHLVNDSLFTDDIHLQAPGNEQVAKALARQLDGIRDLKY